MASCASVQSQNPKLSEKHPLSSKPFSGAVILMILFLDSSFKLILFANKHNNVLCGKSFTFSLNQNTKKTASKTFRRVRFEPFLGVDPAEQTEMRIKRTL